jgi:hypothetical protein
MAKKALGITHPKVAQQWHPEKNGNLKASDFTYGSNQKVWWKCPKDDDHEWEVQIFVRAKAGHGCPCCANLKVCKDNRLDLQFPEIAKEWHPVKNGNLKPSDFVFGSGKKVWWNCPKGEDHEWVAKISDRTGKASGCHCCAGKKLCKDNRFDLNYPEIAKQWHPHKNGDLKPSEFTSMSGKKVWWKCPKSDDHEWEVTIFNRTKSKRCPFCKKK